MNDLRDLFLLRPDVTFLNNGSFGATPRPVFEEYQRLQRELEAEPVDFLALERTLPERLAAVRARLAAFVGADRDEIVLAPNTTFALNAVARSLDLHAGDEILTTDHEYGAMDRLWDFVAEKAGARVVRVDLPCPLDDPAEVVDHVRDAFTDRTRVLFLSHITSDSGVILPIGPLIAEARDRGVLSVIDGAHCPGQIDLDLHDLGCDIYTGNVHKWLLAPKSVALLYVRADRQDLIEPLIVSWGWRPDRPGPNAFVDAMGWEGTRDVSAYLAVPAALDFFAEHDWGGAVRTRCRELLLEGRERLLDVVGMPPLCPPDPWLAQMCAIPLPPGVDGEALHRRLRDEHAVEVPFTRFSGRHWLRFSIQGYNVRSDIDALETALRREPGS